MTHTAFGSLLVLCTGCGFGSAPFTRQVEVGMQSVAALTVDDETRGGGAGAAVEVSLPVWDRAGDSGQLLARARSGVLVGVGLTWLLEAGVAYRVEGFGRWQPDAGLYVGMVTGDLVRTIDDRGERSGSPLILALRLSPLRFALSRGWVSALGMGAGPTLFRPGDPPLAVSLTLLEVGSSF
jgi:hypothetical protein